MVKLHLTGGCQKIVELVVRKYSTLLNYALGLVPNADIPVVPLFGLWRSTMACSRVLLERFRSTIMSNFNINKSISIIIVYIDAKLSEI